MALLNFMFVLGYDRLQKISFSDEDRPLCFPCTYFFKHDKEQEPTYSNEYIFLNFKTSFVSFSFSPFYVWQYSENYFPQNGIFLP